VTVFGATAALTALSAVRSMARAADTVTGTPPPFARPRRLLWRHPRIEDVRVGDRFRAAPCGPELRATNVRHYGASHAHIHARHVDGGQRATVIRSLSDRVWKHRPTEEPRP
jgi:hypothetical protein